MKHDAGRGAAMTSEGADASLINIDLSDEEKLALIGLLADRINADRYPLSPRVRTWRAILSKLRPEPARDPLPPPKHYTPPRAVGARRRRAGP
jgi:hypothetical protein